ncbi:reticulon-4-interacting protein 1 homolog, mitochondrial-like isoform X3 [Eriocheir sinensis]|uniref:reticulon-4-interacting protein 1 homolog, mitochondrial-like isoform X3 n=1 Tax=Eriocheir sinensis TaxID=95602 RepID=UPI0021C7FC8B|nr:reticulon-4-interacting protein 1 homolog, mitochondrial-like isoform X3 [Eriocheir sinensis]XP_050716290.1 reticulon-4-interacting protein 1 homolog, mitochondrial-like isoform X3 [Eriocheir sinensis]
MDHNQTINQLALHSAGSQLTSRLSTLKDGARTALQSSLDAVKNQRFSEEVAERIRSWLAQLKEALSAVSPSKIYDRVFIVFITEVTRTHIYFGGACFCLGGIFGILLGMRLRSSLVAPQRMRAVVINSYRGIEAIGVVEDIVAPRIVDPHQVLVQVKAAGIDYLDIRVAQGYGRVLRRQLNKYNPNTDGEFPAVLGRDCSGVVVAVGRDVSRVEPGEEVWLAVPFYHPGTLSEYVVVSEELVAPKPSQLTFEGAAALPYSIMTAWDALVTQAGLGPDSTAGKRVLVHAGVSGVGVVAVQLVRAWGGSVTTTVSSRAAQLAHMLGAEDVITYDNSNFDKELLLREKYDVILNTVGQVLHEPCLKYCLPDGIVVTTASSLLASDSYGYMMGGLYSLYMRARYWFIKAPWLSGGRWGTLEVKGQVLEKVVPLVNAGQLQAVVDKAYSAQDAEVAFAHVAKGEQIGRTVLRFSINTPIRNLGMAFWQDH